MGQAPLYPPKLYQLHSHMTFGKVTPPPQTVAAVSAVMFLLQKSAVSKEPQDGYVKHHIYAFFTR